MSLDVFVFFLFSSFRHAGVMEIPLPVDCWSLKNIDWYTPTCVLSVNDKFAYISDEELIGSIAHQIA